MHSKRHRWKEKKIEDLDVKIQGNSKGLLEEKAAKKLEDERQKAVNAVEDAKRTIEEKKAQIATDLEKTERVNRLL